MKCYRGAIVADLHLKMTQLSPDSVFLESLNKYAAGEVSEKSKFLWWKYQRVVQEPCMAGGGYR